MPGTMTDMYVYTIYRETDQFFKKYREDLKNQSYAVVIKEWEEWAKTFGLRGDSPYFVVKGQALTESLLNREISHEFRARLIRVRGNLKQRRDDHIGRIRPYEVA